MRIESLLLLLLFALASGRPPSGDRIVGGYPATLGQFPYQVSIRKPGGAGTVHHCGASIVNEYWIVTAAHCAKGLITSDLIIVAGALSITNLTDEAAGVQERRGSRNEIFFDYDIDDVKYDIALMKVAEPFVFNEYVRAIELPSQYQDTPEGTMAVVSGWGASAEGGALSPGLMWVDVPVVSDRECADLYYSVFLETDPSMVCAGYVADGGKDACQGDSGGPLVDPVTGQLVGIVSWGLGCARPELPGVYTEVAYYSDWIKSKIVN